MIDLSKPSRVFIQTNTKAGLDKTGVVAVVILCYGTEPESRLALWYTRTGDACEYMSPTVPIEEPDGTEKKIECLFGGIADDLIKAATAAQARVRKELGKPGYGKIYLVAEKVKELKK